MKITQTNSKWFNFLWQFEYDTAVVDFCRKLKLEYGYEMFNFIKEKDFQGNETIGWGFNNKTIFDEIVAKYPETTTEIDPKDLIETKLEPVSKEPIIKLSDQLETNTKLELYPFQKQGVNFMSETEGKCMIADEMGVGKSVQAITYAHLNNFKTLIICPASLKLMWEDEIKKFTDKTSLVIYADKIKKDPIDIKGYDFVIMNYEIVKKAIENGIDFRDFDLAVCDESFYIKNSKSQRSKTIRTLKYIPRRICLTGTPVLNRPAELWAQLNFIEPDMFKSAWKFYMRYADANKTRFGWDISGASHLDELRNSLKGIMLRRLKKDVLTELPPKTETLIRIKLSTAMWNKYNKLYDEFENLVFTDNKVVQLARLTYLKQFLSLSKLDNAEEIIKNTIESDEKIVVFSQYLEPLHYLKEKFSDNAVVFEGKMNEKEKNEAVKSFQNGKPQVFLGSVMSASTGITLTSSQTVLFIDLPWQPAIISQASDRCHRISQKGNVNIYYMITNDTIDEQIYQLLHGKMKVISDLLQEEELMNIENQSIINEFLAKIKKNRE